MEIWQEKIIELCPEHQARIIEICNAELKDRYNLGRNSILLELSKELSDKMWK